MKFTVISSTTDLNQSITIIYRSTNVDTIFMRDKIDVLIPEEQIERRIHELAAQIEKDYAGKELTFLVTLKGAAFFACELAKRVNLPIYMEFIQAVSYVGTASTGVVMMKLNVDESAITGKNIIIIEDIIDSGRTLAKLKQLMLAHKPASVKICALLDKHECRVIELEEDYIGFTVGNEFLVGYGLDIDQKYRHLPYIGIYRGSQ